MAKSLLPPGGSRCVGRSACPLFDLPRSHAVSNEAAEGALPRAMDAALGAAGKGKAGYVLAGLPAAGGTGAAATAAISAIAAPAGAARPARGGRRERGARGGAAAGGPVPEAPGPALCRPRAARSGALLPAGARRAPHGCGASARGGASVAGVAAARTARRGRAGGGFTARASSAARPQALPLAVLITGASDATSAPGVARVRTPPGGTFRPPSSRLDGGGTQPERLGYVGWAGGAPAALAAPPPLTPPGESARAGGGSRGAAAGATCAGR